jgi:hypothetical protein
LLLHQDRCTKNYYMLHDTRSGLWRRIPWDVEDAFAVDHKDGEGLCPAQACGTGGDSGGYCILSCNQFNTPLFCSRAYPQVHWCVSEREESV